jgi:cell fate (sporulation/competence/biofilm development) regulator YlbF (YheA/YmcA/DUF963 family)
MARRQVKESLNLVAMSMKETLQMDNSMAKESISSLRLSHFMRAISTSITSPVQEK